MSQNVPLPSGYAPDDQVDNGLPDPIWLQVAAILAARIDAGWYERGRLMPSTRQLTQDLGIAINTVRAACRYLEERGMVRVIPGRGIAVEHGGDTESGAGAPE